MNKITRVLVGAVLIAVLVGVGAPAAPANAQSTITIGNVGMVNDPCTGGGAAVYWTGSYWAPGGDSSVYGEGVIVDLSATTASRPLQVKPTISGSPSGISIYALPNGYSVGDCSYTGINYSLAIDGSGFYTIPAGYRYLYYASYMYSAGGLAGYQYIATATPTPAPTHTPSPSATNTATPAGPLTVYQGYGGPIVGSYNIGDDFNISSIDTTGGSYLEMYLSSPAVLEMIVVINYHSYTGGSPEYREYSIYPGSPTITRSGFPDSFAADRQLVAAWSNTTMTVHYRVSSISGYTAPTPTNTATPTITLTPSITPTPSDTPTNTATPTFAPSPTPLPTIFIPYANSVFYDLQNNACYPYCQHESGSVLDSDGLWIGPGAGFRANIQVNSSLFVQSIAVLSFGGGSGHYQTVINGVIYSSPLATPGTFADIPINAQIDPGWITISGPGHGKIVYLSFLPATPIALSIGSFGFAQIPTVAPFPTFTPAPTNCYLGKCGLFATPTLIPVIAATTFIDFGVSHALELRIANQLIGGYKYVNTYHLIDLMFLALFMFAMLRLLFAFVSKAKRDEQKSTVAQSAKRGPEHRNAPNNTGDPRYTVHVTVKPKDRK